MKYFLLLLFLFFFLFVSAQNQARIDSLKNELAKLPPEYSGDGRGVDTTRISILLSLGVAIYLSQPDSALILLTKARDIADKCLTGNAAFSELELIILKKSKADALVNIGYIYGEQGEPQLQLEYSLEAVKIFEKLLDENLDDR
ncbi:hypothetical protein JYT51_01925, partial [Candidatus Amoebophilus asiaticus]|nr:hypothetical protein [Candidatus Amoebophilus asiaticus]